MPRWDRWYELHDLDVKEAERHGYIEWMSGFGVDVVIRKPDARLPDAIAYDYEKHTARYGRYFNNSVSWMLADAIDACEGGEIGLYGVDMAHVSEYSDQRPSCEYMIGVAVGKGITVKVPPQSDLLKTRYLYGVEDPGDFEVKLKARHDELQERIARASKDLDEAAEKLTATAAAVGELRQLRAMLNGHADEQLNEAFDSREAAMSEGINQLKASRRGAEHEKLMLMGALEELRYEREWI